MIVQCPACSSRYRVNASNIPSTGGKIRCPSCQHAFVVYPEAAAAPAAPTPSSYDEDKTSIASRPDLQQLLHNFQQGQGQAATPQEDVGATEIMSGDALPNFADMFGAGSNQAQDADDGTVEMQNPLAFIKQWEQGNANQPDDDEEEDATQIASPDFDFNSFNQAPAKPQGFGAPAQPKRPPVASPPKAQPAASPFKPGAFGGDDPFASGSTQESPSPFSQGGAPFGAPAQPVAQPVAPPMPQAASGPDPNHGGPWKLKTNFGLTYEFVDTQNLLQWMSSRDELDGYMLSGGNEQFFPVKDFPQIAQGLSAGGRTRTSRPSNLSTGPIPPVPGANPPANPVNFGPAPNQGFGAPPNLPGPRGDLIQNNNFQPPSRDAAWNKVLWVVFILLFVGAVAIALQLSGVVDLKGMVLGTPPTPTVTPTPTPTPPPTPTPKVEEPVIQADDSEVEALLKDARRAIKNHKLPSAKDKLEAAKLLAPDRVEVYQMLADVHEQLGEAEQAEKARAKAASLGGTPAQGADMAADAGQATDESGSEPPAK